METKKRKTSASGIVPTPQQIKQARGLYTQIQASKMLHTSQPHFSDYERGRRHMHVAYWELFCLKTNNRDMFKQSQIAK